jgi:hypothetical protein
MASLRRCGRKPGFGNYRADILLNVVEVIKPTGMSAWEEVAEQYMRMTGESGLRQAEDMKRHFNQSLCNSGKRPLENSPRMAVIERAQAIYASIWQNRVSPDISSLDRAKEHSAAALMEDDNIYDHHEYVVTEPTSGDAEIEPTASNLSTHKRGLDNATVRTSKAARLAATEEGNETFEANRSRRPSFDSSDELPSMNDGSQSMDYYYYHSGNSHTDNLPQEAVLPTATLGPAVNLVKEPAIPFHIGHSSSLESRIAALERELRRETEARKADRLEFDRLWRDERRAIEERFKQDRLEHERARLEERRMDDERRRQERMEADRVRSEERRVEEDRRREERVEFERVRREDYQRNQLFLVALLKSRGELPSDPAPSNSDA